MKRPLGFLVLLCIVLTLVLTLGGCRGAMTAMPVTGSTPGSGAVGSTSDQTATTQSPIKRLIVVDMQNRSFDNLFGTFPGADGFHPGAPGYSQVDAAGTTVTPFLITTDATGDLKHSTTYYRNAWDNGKMDQYAAVEGDLSMGYYDNTQAHVATLWNYAGQYALADRYFSSGMGAEPINMFYLVSAFDNNFPFTVQPIYGPCQKPDPAAKAATWPNVGDQMSTAGISWGWFHENYGDCGNYVAAENPFQFFTTTQGGAHITDLSVFTGALASGNIPSVSFIQPAPSHDMHPGSGPVSRSVDWLDNFIKQVQASPAWDSTAIVVIWDESGGWYDHVPPPQVDSQGYGARVPMLVISPYAKKGYISHQTMDHTSILRFIQWNWGLQPLNGRATLDANINLKDMFAF